MKLKRILLPFTSSPAIFGESLMLPLFAVALGIWINPLDPLWTQSTFPWAWFAPVVLALRYGPFPGLAGAGVLLVAWLAFSFSGWLPGDFPKTNFLGGLIFVMLCGEFSSTWINRARRAEGVQLYLDQRLETLTHEYYLLRLSHDRIEQDLIARPMAMRDALVTLQQMVADKGAAESASAAQLPGGDELLRLLAQYCQIETAVLHPVADGGVAKLPVASLGAAADAAPFDAEDPLIQHALETGRLAHVLHALAASENPSRYIIVAPLKTFAGETIGVLAIEHVPFFALHDEMLQTLNLLLGYYTDGLVTQQLSASICAALPFCPPDFAAELQRLWRVREESGVRSVIVALEFRDCADFADVVQQIHRQRRSLDVSWLVEADGCQVLANLMPLAGAAAAEGYIARITDWAQRRRQQTLTEAGIFPHIVYIDGEAPLAVLKQLFTVCNVPSQTPSPRLLRAGA